MVARLQSLAVALMLLFAIFAASGQASAALMLIGPANDLQGAGAIATAGATEIWTFDVNAAGGAFDLFGTSDAFLILAWEVRNPSNVVVASAAAANPGDPLQQLDLPLTSAGVWTIVVEGLNSTTGSYTLEVVGNADAHILGTVPEPTTLPLLGLALAGLAASRRRKQ